MSQQQMPNPVEFFEQATNRTKRIVAGVQRDQLNSPTPCTEWNVQALLDHMLQGLGYITGALSGRGPEAAPAGSPAQAYEASVARALQAARQPGAMTSKVQSPIGEITGGQFLSVISMDHLVHSWDLAKATGQDTNLDPQLVEVCYNMFVPDMVEGARSRGAFGPAVSVPANASLQDKLLGYMGRKP